MIKPRYLIIPLVNKAPADQRQQITASIVLTPPGSEDPDKAQILETKLTLGIMPLGKPVDIQLFVEIEENPRETEQPLIEEVHVRIKS